MRRSWEMGSQEGQRLCSVPSVPCFTLERPAQPKESRSAWRHYLCPKPSGLQACGLPTSGTQWHRAQGALGESWGGHGALPQGSPSLWKGTHHFPESTPRNPSLSFQGTSPVSALFLEAFDKWDLGHKRSCPEFLADTCLAGVAISQEFGPSEISRGVHPVQL